MTGRRRAAPSAEAAPPALTDADYERLLEFRQAIRGFLRWSEAEAARRGITAGQHQLLLAIRGEPRPGGPSIGDVAKSLFIHHHAAVGLVDRAATAGLVRRRLDPHDHRVVRLALTASGSRCLAELSAAHLEELARFEELFRRSEGDVLAPPRSTETGR